VLCLRSRYRRRRFRCCSRSFLCEGIALQALHRYDEALARFAEAAACDSNDPAPRAAAAELLAKLGRENEAAAQRKEAQALAARNAAYA
jgi:Flp pilus assembly protein TadD